MKAAPSQAKPAAAGMMNNARSLPLAEGSKGEGDEDQATSSSWKGHWDRFCGTRDMSFRKT